MKTTGIVRRFDDLGRVVIPKEIRRTLRIRDGESLEIFVDNDKISLKKFSSLNEFTTISEGLCDAVSTAIKKTIMITNTDKVVAVSSDSRNKFLNKTISKTLERLIESRNDVVRNNVSVEIVDKVTCKCSYLVYPIMFGGDVFGLVVIMSHDSGINTRDEQVASIIRNFLEKNMSITLENVLKIFKH